MTRPGWSGPFAVGQAGAPAGYNRDPACGFWDEGAPANGMVNTVYNWRAEKGLQTPRPPHLKSSL